MYTPSGTLDRDHLIRQYAPLVKRLAYHLMARLPASVQLEDVIQNGMLGLLDAIGRYEDGLGAQFETYAAQRIRGAMLDGLRDNDWLPRSARREMRRIEAAVNELEQQLGRTPSESELAQQLGVSLPEYQRMLLDARGHQLLYFEDFAADEDGDFFDTHLVDQRNNPLDLLQEQDMRQLLVQGITELPEREQLVMSLYYEEDLNLREIGEVLGVSESRVCQLHSQAIARLRAKVLDSAPVKKARRGRPPKKAA